jgi:5'-nucleotidase/UDP-sugar diphosphatase
VNRVCKTNFLAVLFLLVCLLPAPVRADCSEVRAAILFLGDLQSQMLPVSRKVNKTTVFFGGLVNGAAVLEKEKAKEPEALILQGGDAVSGLMWHSFGGEPEFSALEAAGVQALLPGNHEFNYGAGHLKKGLNRISIPALASNLRFDDPELADRIKEKIILHAGDVPVGIFGIASPTLFAQASPGSGVHLDKDCAAVSAQMVRELREEGAEIIVALSRLSKNENEELASFVEGIHAILGGSSNVETVEPLFVKNPGGHYTLLAEAGVYGAFVGKLHLTVEGGKLKREGSSWELIRVTPAWGSHREVEQIARSFEDRLNEATLSTVGVFENSADGRAATLRTAENPLGSFLADALRWRLRTDIGMINGGGVRGDKVYPAGNVSWKTLHEMLPFNNPIHVVSLTGEQIKQVLELSASALIDESYDPKTRVPTGAFMQISGLRVEISPKNPPTLVDEDGKLIEWGARLKSVLVQSGEKLEPIDEDRIYTVAINSYNAGGGDKLFVFPEGNTVETDILDIDAAVEYLMSRRGRKASFFNDGRITFTGE